MSYLALARQWRPRSFESLLGQGIIKQALVNALTQQRLHHAYLFTGTRGVGKTSIARLFAKALNCEQGISATPCLTCETCLAIEQGRFTDLLEIDGASKTRVEDTRDLLDNVQYAPTCGRFKIYLIDEVHMLSQHSFNALLKTLEEPPAHVKFLLATTDPQKLPVTILSRCLQFHLKPLTPELITEQLQIILTHEKIEASPEALQLIAHAAQGSMRDGLSLLEQAITCADKAITADSVKTILGYTYEDYALKILQALSQQQSEPLIEISHQIAKEGGHYPYVLETLLHHLHQLTILNQLPAGSLWATPLLALHTLKDAFAPETLQLFYEITLKGLQHLKLLPSVAVGFEMTLLRLLAFQPQTTHTPPPPQAPKQVQAAPITSSPDPEPATPQASKSWSELIQAFKLTGPTLNAAEQAEFTGQVDATLTLQINESHRSLFAPNIIKRIETAASTHFKKPIKVRLTIKTIPQSPARIKQDNHTTAQLTATQLLQNDPTFTALKTQFDAEIIPESVQMA